EDNAFSLLAECPNLLILRTFSKAFGLAGMRFGYCLCAPELAAEISKVQLPHHVNYFTQTAALVLLGHKDLVEQRVAEIKREREFIEREISVLTGVKVFPSEANFLLVEFSTKTPDDMFNALLETGILVRNISNYPGLSHCLRITVGPGEDNRALVKALAGVLS
ncbi:MAG: histidinol-phosphate transaminase, partial [Gemmatimonadota bacterium]|nr:histidinol-phosphate transaminase [Gemmatimonadota bacterium]